MRPASSYFICCMPRSGSWMLADALKATQLAGRPEEYFWDEFYESYLARWGWPRIESYADFLDQAVRRGSTTNGVFGAKLHWGELDQLCRALRTLPGAADRSPQELLAEQFPCSRFIHLTRVDRVRQAISWYRAFHTADWYQVREEERAPSAAPEPDWAQIRALENELAAGEQRWQSFFEESGNVPLGVVYEDLVSDYEATVRTVLTFLDIPGAGDVAIAPTRLLQQRDETTEQWVAGYLKARRELWPPEDECYGRGLVDRWDSGTQEANPACTGSVNS